MCALCVDAVELRLLAIVEALPVVFLRHCGNHRVVVVPRQWQEPSEAPEHASIADGATRVAQGALQWQPTRALLPRRLIEW